jgi:DNA-binding MarR family transcriptional regulator
MARRARKNAQAEKVADALHSAAIHLLRRVRKEDERTGLPPGRLSALSVLVFGGPMRLTQLARIEGVRPPTMTRIVAGLALDGLVRRSPEAADRRAVRLEATPAGTSLMHLGRKRRVARLAGALRQLPPDDVETLQRAAALIEQVSARMLP